MSGHRTHRLGDEDALAHLRQQGQAPPALGDRDGGPRDDTGEVEHLLVAQWLVVLADHEAHERTLQHVRELGIVLGEQGDDGVGVAVLGGQGDLRTRIGGLKSVA